MSKNSQIRQIKIILCFSSKDVSVTIKRLINQGAFCFQTLREDNASPVVFLATHSASSAVTASCS